MMFRRAADEDDESGSDWDDMTPRTTTPILPTTATITASNSTQNQTPSSPRGDIYAVGAPLQQPALEVTNTENNPHMLLVHDNANKLIPQGARRGREESHLLSAGSSATGIKLPNRGVRWNTDTSTIMLEDELTSIATAVTPQPPPLRPAPPVAYTAGTTWTQGREEEGVELAGTPLKGQRAADRAEGDDGIDDYKSDVEFTTVNDQRVDYLYPSRRPPKAYMTRLATKWEGHSERCVEEVCSSMRIVSDFIIAVVLGSVHCVLNHVVRKLCCGLGHLFTDALCKPCIALVFNGLLWPVIACLVQVSRGVVLIIGPQLEVVGVLMTWLVQIARACRLVSITNKTPHTSPSTSTSKTNTQVKQV